VTWLGESLGPDNRFKSSDLPVQTGLDPNMNNIPSTLIWPIVQAHNNPGIVSPEEFRLVLREGSKAPASGIMMFSAESIAEEPEKIEVLREFYVNKNSKD
jgi:hypothetical protein